MLSELSLQEHNAKYPATGSRGKFHNIRINARKVMKDANVTKECKKCGFNLYVEVCHIKAISDFPPEALIKEINSLDNLMYLCPNCHWRLDHNCL